MEEVAISLASWVNHQTFTFGAGSCFFMPTDEPSTFGTPVRPFSLLEGNCGTTLSAAAGCGVEEADTPDERIGGGGGGGIAAPTDFLTTGSLVTTGFSWRVVVVGLWDSFTDDA